MLFFLLACGSSETPAPEAPKPAAPPAEAPKPAEAPAPAEPELPTLRVEALVATSGDADGIANGKGWRPEGDPRGEGILVRFTEPTEAVELDIHSCTDRSFAITPFYNGGQGDKIRVEGSSMATQLDGALRTLFLRIDRGQACIDKLIIERDGTPYRLIPPRRIDGTVTTSSTLEPEDAYHPSYVFDARNDFGWVEGSEGNGVAETLTVKLAEPIALRKIQLWNGYQRSQDHFEKNTRISKLAVSVGGAREEYTIDPDRQGPQELDIAAGVQADTITLEVLEAKEGTRYKDLVISELRLWDDKGPLAVRTTDGPARAKVLKQAASDTAIGPMIDRLYQGYCTDSGRRTFKLRSDHSFVWYASTGESSEVFDGAWVLREGKPGYATIQLYGRRHRAEPNWDPYADDEATETIRIAGGTPMFHSIVPMDQNTFDELTSQVREAEGRDCDMDREKLAASGGIIVIDRSLVDVLIPAP